MNPIMNFTTTIKRSPPARKYAVDTTKSPTNGHSRKIPTVGVVTQLDPRFELVLREKRAKEQQRVVLEKARISSILQAHRASKEALQSRTDRDKDAVRAEVYGTAELRLKAKQMAAKNAEKTFSVASIENVFDPASVRRRQARRLAHTEMEALRHELPLSKPATPVAVQEVAKKVAPGFGPDLVIAGSLSVVASCKGLISVDTFSLSDPMVCVFRRRANAPGDKWAEIARTEAVRDNLEPVFKKPILITFDFNEPADLQFRVHDEDNGQPNELLGLIETSLHQLATTLFSHQGTGGRAGPLAPIDSPPLPGPMLSFHDDGQICIRQLLEAPSKKLRERIQAAHSEISLQCEIVPERPFVKRSITTVKRAATWTQRR